MSKTAFRRNQQDLMLSFLLCYIRI